MYSTTNLKKRGNIWYCIKSVPPSLVAVIGKHHLVKSLHTGDLRIANTRKLSVLADFQAQIESARARQIVSDSSRNTGKHDDFINALIKIAKERRTDKDVRDELDYIVDNYSDKHGFNNHYPDEESNIPEEFESAVKTAYQIADGNHLVSDTVELYLENEKGTVTEQTWQEKKTHLKRFQDFIKHDIVIQNVSRIKIRDYLNDVVMPSPTNPKTKAKIFNNVKQWLNWCSDRGYIEQSPALGLKVSNKKHKVHTEDESRKAWTDEDVNTILQALNSDDGEFSQDKLDLQKIVKIGMYSGMRLGEICEMKVEDITNDCFFVKDGKTESATRWIPIHSDIKDYVNHLVDNSSDGYLIEGLVRRGADNKRMWNIQKRFGRFKTKLGFGKDKVFHSFRKAFITKLQRAGVIDHTVKQIVGHSNQDITFGLYSDGLEIEQLKEAIELVKYDLN